MGVCGSLLSASASFAALYELDDKQLLAERPFAAVYAGRHRATGAPVTVKRILKQHPPPPSSFSASPSPAPQETRSSTSGTGWENELAAIRRCSPPPLHPNVIRFDRVFESRREVLVVMEHVGGGQLFDALISDGAYSEWDARRFVKDALEALKFLHGRGIVHRDITPENLLFTTRNSKTASIKVVNFATAKLLNDHATAPLTLEQLSWAYCAPEVLATIDSFASRLESIRGARAGSATEDIPPINALNALEVGEPANPVIARTTSTRRDRARSGTKHSNPADEAKCDVWSVGIVLYVLLSGAHPFDLDGRQTRDQIVQNILLGSFSMSDESSVWNLVSREAKELLTLLLDVDPAKRPSAAEALDHAWFASPHTPREPLSVSVLDGLGQYQRLMRKKFRTSVLAAMAVEVFRRSLKKQKDEAAALAVAAAGAADGGGPGSQDAGPQESQSPPGSGLSAAAAGGVQGVAEEYFGADHVGEDRLGTEDVVVGDIRPAEHTRSASGESAPSTANGAGVVKQGSVLSRVFQRREPFDGDNGDTDVNREAVGSGSHQYGGQGALKDSIESDDVRLET